jgi:hypothetical protein
MRYQFLILDTYHPDTLYLLEQGCEHPWLFLEAKIGPRAKPFEKQWSGQLNSMSGKPDFSEFSVMCGAANHTTRQD